MTHLLLFLSSLSFYKENINSEHAPYSLMNKRNQSFNNEWVCPSRNYVQCNLEAYCWVWFLLEVSVLATNRSCLFVQTLLCFAGFHRQLSSGLLQGLLYLEVCKPRSASGIELEIMTFRKSMLIFFWFELCSFFSKNRNYFCVLSYRFPQVTVTAYPGTSLAKVQHVQLCCEHAGFYCESWDCLWALVSIHRETLSTVVRPANTCMETRLYKTLWSRLCLLYANLYTV